MPRHAAFFISASLLYAKHMPKDTHAKLQTGQTVPDFTVTAVDGSTVTSAELAGQHTLLSFFRYAGCPFCDLTLIKLIERYQNFSARGLKVVAFFQSDKADVADYATHRCPPFPIVADPHKKIYDLFSVESTKRGLITSLPKAAKVGVAIARGTTSQPKITGDAFLMPAQFLVAPDKTLQIVHYGTNFGDKIPFIEIERILLTEIAA
jgi:thioredoxin-dependent peroxiredoxin